MPIFEYICKDCSREFELIVHGTARPKCPHCESAKLGKKLSVFAVAGSSKSESVSQVGGCGSCGDPRGPGACSLDD